MSETHRQLALLVILPSLLIALLFGLAWQPAEQYTALAAAGTHFVAPGGDCGGATPCYASIQAAVDQAAAGDEIKIATGLYIGVNGQGGLSQVVFIGKSLSLRGGYTIYDWNTADPVANPTTLDAQGEGRAIAVIGPADVTLVGLRLTGGDAAGLRGNPSNSSANAGGGLYAHTAALTVDSSAVYGNTASTESSKAGHGGGVFVHGGSLALHNTKLEWNLGSPVYYGLGGGLYVDAGQAVDVTDCLIQHNTGSTNQANAGGGSGGGVYLGDSTATLAGNTIAANTGSTGPGNLASASGGGVYVSGGSITLTANLVSNNTASLKKAGWGGGINLFETEANLVDNTIEGNMASASSTDTGAGGGLYAHWNVTVTLTGNFIRNNTAAIGGTGWGGGICIDDGSATLASNTVTGNQASTGSAGYGGGISLQGQSVTALQDNTIASNTASTAGVGYGGGLYLYESRATLLDNDISGSQASSVAAGYGGGIDVAASSVLTLTGNLLQDNAAGAATEGLGGGLRLSDSQAILSGNAIIHNRAVSNGADPGTGGGLYSYASDLTMVNNVVAGNHATTHGAGVWFSSWTIPSHLGQFVHNTIADNNGCGEGVYADGRAELTLANTIVAGHTAFGIVSNVYATASLESTLWHDNGADSGGGGVIIRHNDYTGDPVFVAPFTGDYHLAGSSAAIDRGIDAQVGYDLDGEPRPNGPAPDLGADEYYASGGEAFAEKAAFAPQWFFVTDPGSGQVQSTLRQRYLLQFRHYDVPGWVAVVTDTLPAELAFESELHTPAMAFEQQAGSLTWQTEGVLPPGQTAQVLLATSSEEVVPLSTLVNEAGVSAGPWDFDLQAASQVPLFPPLIVAPGNGEICPGALEVSGIAQPNTTVTLYQNGVEMVTTTSGPDGAFAATYYSIAVGYDTVFVTAVACLQAANTECSAPSSTVTLTSPLSFICPQPSLWENTPASGPFAGQLLTYRFLDEDGWFVGDGGVFHFIRPHINSTIHLYRRSCTEMGCPPDSVEHVWVEVEEDDVVVATYQPSSVNLPWYHFDIDMELADVSREVIFYLSCEAPPGAAGAQAEATIFSAQMGVESDLEGTVFDVTQGFDPANPGEHGVEGVSVTAMVSSTAWGGWVPWPAHLYNDQANPQVTGDDGYFAFFAPPGSYYLQIGGGPDYQSWRSPVIEIGAQPLHMNVPLTPRSQPADQGVSLGTGGPNPAVVTVAVGDAVEWSVEVDPDLSPEEQMERIDNPLLRPHSEGALDPLTNTLGFDGGMMIPGSAYQRQFIQPGSYAYSDGAGHTGLVVVQFRVYLPLILR